jgi:hypothetical protein
MEGNSTDDIRYAIRITFGIVHGVILTVFALCLALLFPSLSHFLFGLFGCIVAPLLSFVLTLFCNGCVEYVSSSTITLARVLKRAWIPPLGVFCCSLLILPLELMPSLGFTGPINTLIATSIVLNFIVTTLLQVYSAKSIQDLSQNESKS